VKNIQIPLTVGSRDPSEMKRARSLSSLVTSLAIALAGAACDSDPLPGPDGNGPATSAPIATSSTGAPTPTMDAPPGADQPPATGFPCDVRAVMQASCANCHAGHLYYGPNFFTRDQLFLPAADLFAVLPKDPIAPGTFGEHIATALRDDVMPPATYGVTMLPTDTERQLVIAWVDAGMPAGSCGALSSTP
jgi:hypothetical protein